ncbi:LamG-like jellyroll fold domain-containing protein [Marmoricola sp. RAF53]|uniref:LamG-like jellyroll fold domain-containing protein n=1 Tax=Marmoricola sp. RAF53 TaxID=3233059 RepID=UPI003F969C2F
MRYTLKIVLALALLGTGIQLLAPAGPAAAATKRSAYVRSVLRDRPSALLQGVRDLTGHRHRGTAVGSPGFARMPNGDRARRFNGRGQYLRFADSKAFEIDATGALTVEYWMRPDTLQFRDTEGSGYVYVLGKGNPGSQEWLTRMYSRQNQESRPNRISGYSFNPQGGLGAGSYFQDPVAAGRWIHVALVVNSRARSSAYPMGYVKIYKNGVLRDTDSLQGYGIVPRSGTAPLRVGTGYLSSFFQGAVGNIAFYGREVSGKRLRAHYLAGR